MKTLMILCIAFFCCICLALAAPAENDPGVQFLKYNNDQELEEIKKQIIVYTERSWFYEKENVEFRERPVFNEKVYFPGKTNENELANKRLNKEVSRSFLSDNNSNRIDDDNYERSTLSRKNSEENSSEEKGRRNVNNSSRRNTNKNSSDENGRGSSFRKNSNNIENSKERSNRPTSSSRSNSKSSTSDMRVCEIKYAEYLRRIFPEESDIDTDANDAEFNGRVLAAPGQYPHMTALGFRSANGQVDYKCGGSLISENFVITAAHCANLTGLQPTKVRIGDLNLMVEENYLEPQIRNIKKIHVHPEYRTSSYYNDIALLELKDEVDLTEFVRPIRLWTRPTFPFLLAYAMGYGSTDFAKERTNRLTNLNMTIIPNDECSLEMPKLPETANGIISSQICARDFAQNRDTCQGDSGGPLQLNIRGRKRRNRLHYHLIGITSYGLYCRSGYPSIFTRVYSYLDWIEHIVWRENFD